MRLFRVGTAICAAIVGLSLLGGCNPGEMTAEAAAQEPNRSSTTEVGVEVIVPERTTLRRTTTQPAIVHAYYRAEIRAKISGYLDQLKVDIGDEVEAGDVLGIVAMPELQRRIEKQQAAIEYLESNEQETAAQVTVAQAGIQVAEAMLAHAQANLAKAKAAMEADRQEFERTSDLVERQSVTNRLLDEARKRYESSQAAVQAAEAAIATAKGEQALAEAELNAAKARLASSRSQTEVARRELKEIEALLGYATIQAPFSGVVIERNVAPGDLVRNSEAASSTSREPLFVIAAIDKLRVRVPVPEDDVPWLDVGDQAIVELRSQPGKPVEGSVTRIARSVEDATRTMLAEIDVQNPDHRLVPGMYGQGRIILDAKPNSLVLPAAAVRYDNQGKGYVYAVGDDNVIVKLEVVTGLDDGRSIEIISGLGGDERIIAQRADNLRPGQLVRINGE